MRCPFPNNRVETHQISEINDVPFQQVPVASVCMMPQNATLKKDTHKEPSVQINSPTRSMSILHTTSQVHIFPPTSAQGGRTRETRESGGRWSPPLWELLQFFPSAFPPLLCLSEENYHYCCLNRRGISYDWICRDIRRCTSLTPTIDANLHGLYISNCCIVMTSWGAPMAAG